MLLIGICVFDGCVKPSQTIKELLQRNILASGGMENLMNLNTFGSYVSHSV